MKAVRCPRKTPRKAFGAVPPDLSLIARARKPEVVVTPTCAASGATPSHSPAGTQLRVPLRGDAARAGTSGRARNARCSRPVDGVPVFEKVRVRAPGDDESGKIRRGHARPDQLPGLPRRAGETGTLQDRRVRDTVPAGVPGIRVSPEEGILEGHPLTPAAANRGPEVLPVTGGEQAWLPLRRRANP